MEDFKQGEVLWGEVRGRLGGEVRGVVFDTWLRDSWCLGFDGEVLRVGVKDAFVKEWIERRLFSKLEQALMEVAEARGLGRVRLVVQLPSSEGPDEECTFSQFIVGTGNYLAYQAAREVAERPGRRFNPLFLYSGPGLGKTHLLRAIAYTAREKRLSPLYIRAQRFTEEFIFSLRNGWGYQFREKFLRSDILLLDELHLLCGKAKTTDSFLHILKELTEEKKQVVVSSLLPPQELALPESLSSLLQAGVVIPIAPPDRELRLNFLKAKARQLQLPLSNEFLHQLADKEAKNFTTLLGYLNQIMAGRFPSQEPPSRGQEIVKAVARYFRLPEESLLGKSRRPQVSLARAILIYLLHEEDCWSFSQIAQKLDLSKSSVIYSWKKVSQELKESASMQKALNQIKELIYAGKS